MADTVIPTGINKLPPNFTIKEIESQLSGFKQLFGIIEINGRELFYLKNGESPLLEANIKDKEYFESNIFIPKGLKFVTGANLDIMTDIEDLPKEHLLPLFVSNTMKTTDTNVCQGLYTSIQPNQTVEVYYKAKMKNPNGQNPPLEIDPVPNCGTSTCVQGLLSPNNNLCVFYSTEDIPLHETLLNRYPAARGPHYFIPTLMPDLALCLIASPNKDLMKQWADKLSGLTTVFSGAINTDVVPVDDWKTFITFVDEVPSRYQIPPLLREYNLSTIDKKVKLKVASFGGIRFIENLNAKR